MWLDCQVDDGILKSEAENHWGDMERQVVENGGKPEPWEGFLMFRKQEKNGRYRFEIKAPKQRKWEVSSPQAL